MRKLNLIVIFSKKLDKVLFCIRAKEPYKGLYNIDAWGLTLRDFYKKDI